MKIEFRLLQKLQSQSVLDKHAPKLSEYSRPIMNERDYRDSKASLAQAMRSAPTAESALRAEALLREIVDYEMRLDIDEEESFSAYEELSDYEGPRRRWSDRFDD